MNGFWIIGASLLCVVVAAPEGAAQQIASRSVIGSGGGSGGAGRLSLAGTLGQPVAGLARAAGRDASHGFWSTARPAAASMDADWIAVTGREAASTLDLSASPNPLSSGTELTVRVPDGAPAAITLFDMLGRTVLAIPVDGSAGSVRRIWIDAVGLPSGGYSAVLTSAAGRRAIRLLIAR